MDRGVRTAIAPGAWACAVALGMLAGAGCGDSSGPGVDAGTDGGGLGVDAGMDASPAGDAGDAGVDSEPLPDAEAMADAGPDLDAAAWPPGSPCEEGMHTPTCTDGVAEASCEDQLVFFSQRAMDEAGAYWSVPKPAGGFRMADRFAQGHAYLRLQVYAKPDDLEVFPQVCFWRWDPDASCGSRWTGFAETCASRSVGYSTTGTYYFDLGAPDSWWKRPTPAWSWARTFDAMRIMHFADYMGEKHLLKDSSCGTACWPVAGGAAAHMPIDADGELIVVAEGATFSPPASWSDCAEPFCS